MRPLHALEQGGAASWFLAATNPKAARKQWISGMKSKGILIVDDGAAQALASGKSLLAAGVRNIHGSFQRGDLVSIAGPNGMECAKGLVGYSSDETEAIAGRQSHEIAGILGYAGRAALIHRDDMVN